MLPIIEHFHPFGCGYLIEQEDAVVTQPRIYQFHVLLQIGLKFREFSPALLRLTHVACNTSRTLDKFSFTPF